MPPNTRETQSMQPRCAVKSPSTERPSNTRINSQSHDEWVFAAAQAASAIVPAITSSESASSAGRFQLATLYGPRVVERTMRQMGQVVGSAGIRGTDGDLLY